MKRLYAILVSFFICSTALWGIEQQDHGPNSDQLMSNATFFKQELLHQLDRVIRYGDYWQMQLIAAQLKSADAACIMQLKNAIACLETIQHELARRLAFLTIYFPNHISAISPEKLSQLCMRLSAIVSTGNPDDLPTVIPVSIAQQRHAMCEYIEHVQKQSDLYKIPSWWQRHKIATAAGAAAGISLAIALAANYDRLIPMSQHAWHISKNIFLKYLINPLTRIKEILIDGKNDQLIPKELLENKASWLRDKEEDFMKSETPAWNAQQRADELDKLANGSSVYMNAQLQQLIKIFPANAAIVLEDLLNKKLRTPAKAFVYFPKQNQNEVNNALVHLANIPNAGLLALQRLLYQVEKRSYQGEQDIKLIFPLLAIAPVLLIAWGAYKIAQIPVRYAWQYATNQQLLDKSLKISLLELERYLNLQLHNFTGTYDMHVQGMILYYTHHVAKAAAKARHKIAYLQFIKDVQILEQMNHSLMQKLQHISIMFRTYPALQG